MQPDDKEIEVLQGISDAGGTVDHATAIELYSPSPCETMVDFGYRVDSLQKLRNAGFIAENVEELELSLTDKGRTFVKANGGEA